MTRNVVLLCLDTVRKDYYDEYAPRLRERSGTRFERFYAASSWSMPSHGSIFTEVLPHQHSLHPSAEFSFESLPPEETFLGDLTDHTTLGISANTYASSSFGFDSLFDEFHDYAADALFQLGLKPQHLQRRTGAAGAERYRNFLRAALTHDHPIRSVANGGMGVCPWKDELSASRFVPYTRHREAEGIAQLARSRIQAIDEPFFLFVNAMDAHSPFQVLDQYDESLHDVPDTWDSDELELDVRNDPKPAPDADAHLENYRQLYRCAVDYLDRTASQFVDDIATVTDRETSIIVFSDHGEALGYEQDEYMVGHNNMSNAVLHTPGDIINPPDGFPETVTDPVSHLSIGELVRTIAADGEFPTDVRGDEVPAEVPRAGGLRKSEQPESPYLERMVRALVTKDQRIEWDSLGHRRAFELQGGFPESESLVADEVSIPERVSAYFDTSMASYESALDVPTPETMAIDDGTRERLRELGYL